MHGGFETIGNRPALRFERRIAHPVERVWRALTEPGELAHWFPSEVGGDLRPGGRMSFTFAGMTLGGEVTELDPPRIFAFTWGEDRLRFELEPVEDGCLLRLTVILDARDKAARDAAGWHMCLDRLEQLVAGREAAAPSSEPTSEWRGHYDEYARRGLPTGAPIPE